MNEERIDRAAEWIKDSEALVITAGAGMGVDSGLPDFRGDHGFWTAYPPYAKLGLGFTSLANPRWFRDDPAFAWGFYGHRLNLYRDTIPHQGFQILRRWAAEAPFGGFVFTSNVDGHFQKAGFPSESIIEAHGAIDYLQCHNRCGLGIFPADRASVVVDETTMRADEPHPRCPRCGTLARPNILMFGDAEWDFRRTEDQYDSFQRWLDRASGARVVVIECGAGGAVPTVRDFGHSLVRQLDAKFIRINLRESDVPDGHIGISMGALEALSLIHRRIGFSS